MKLQELMQAIDTTECVLIVNKTGKELSSGITVPRAVRESRRYEQLRKYDVFCIGTRCKGGMVYIEVVLDTEE